MSIDFVAGWCGGAAGMAVGQPFDTVKARLQTDGLYGTKKTYRGPYHCLTQIVKQEGSRALFKGMAAPLLGMAALNSIVFGVHGNLMNRFQKRSGGPDAVPGLHYSFISGFVAGFAQTIIASPTEMIKLRLQFQRDKTDLIPRSLHHHHKTGSQCMVYSGPWDAFKKIYRKDGVLKGLGKGYWVTCIRDVPAFALYFGTYDFLCRAAVRWKSVEHIDQLSPVTICVAGGVGGVASWAITYPVDVVKSRFQIDGMDPSRATRYSSATDCFMQSLRSSEGWRGFFLGLSPTLLRAFPVNAVTFVTVALILREYRQFKSKSLRS